MFKVSIAKYAYIFTSIAIFILGLVCFFYPQISPLILCRVMGIVVIIAGIAKLYGYFTKDLFRIAFQFDFALGILTIVLGILLIVFPERFMVFLTTLIAVFVIVDAVFAIQNSFEAKEFGVKKWWIILVCGIVAALIGIAAIIVPFEGSKFLMRLIGLSFMTDGAQNVVMAYLTVKYRKKNAVEEDNE